MDSHEKEGNGVFDGNGASEGLSPPPPVPAYVLPIVADPGVTPEPQKKKPMRWQNSAEALSLVHCMARICQTLSDLYMLFGNGIGRPQASFGLRNRRYFGNIHRSDSPSTSAFWLW